MREQCRPAELLQCLKRRPTLPSLKTGFRPPGISYFS